MVEDNALTGDRREFLVERLLLLGRATCLQIGATLKVWYMLGISFLKTVKMLTSTACLCEAPQSTGRQEAQARKHLPLLSLICDGLAFPHLSHLSLPSHIFSCLHFHFLSLLSLSLFARLFALRAYLLPNPKQCLPLPTTPTESRSMKCRSTASSIPHSFIVRGSIVDCAAIAIVPSTLVDCRDTGSRDVGSFQRQSSIQSIAAPASQIREESVTGSVCWLWPSAMVTLRSLW